MSQLHSAFTLFLSLIVEAMPFLLMGVMLSSAIAVLLDERRVLTRFPQNPVLGALLGSCIGFLFPVCECGNVPVARRLLLQRVPVAAAVGFLLAAPTVNPIVIWSTWVAFRDQPEIVILRVLFSLGIAVVIGCIFSVQKDARVLLQPTLSKQLGYLAQRSARSLKWSKKEPVPALLQSGTFLLGQSEPIKLENAAAVSSWPSEKLFSLRLKQFLDNLVQELRELGGMLILGSAIAAAIQVLAPRELILSLGQGPITSILAMMLLAGLVSICSTVDAFFALSFASAFTTGSLLAFLVFGPMVDLKSIGLMLSVFKSRIVIYLFAIAAQLTFILALSYTYFF